jgi:hypothetical protein
MAGQSARKLDCNAVPICNYPEYPCTDVRPTKNLAGRSINERLVPASHDRRGSANRSHKGLRILRYTKSSHAVKIDMPWGYIKRINRTVPQRDRCTKHKQDDFVYSSLPGHSYHAGTCFRSATCGYQPTGTGLFPASRTSSVPAPPPRRTRPSNKGSSVR